MNQRSLLPVVVIIVCIAQLGIFALSHESATWESSLPNRSLRTLRALSPPPHTTLDDIDPATLLAGCPQLSHEPWRGRILTLAEYQTSSSAFVLMGGEPLAITGETFSTLGRRQIPQTRFSLSALPINPSDPAQTRTILSREFRWFVHEDRQALYYYEQPAVDGQDSVVALDRSTFEEKRWSLPHIPPPAGLMDPPTYNITIAGTTLDGKLIVQIYTGEWGAGDPAFPPRVHSGLCLIDPQHPSSGTPPPYVIVSDLLPIAMSWPTGPNEILALAQYPKKQERLLIDVRTGAIREVAPTEARFRGYGEMPPHIATDQAINAFLGRTTAGVGDAPSHAGGIVRGTAAVNLSMPSTRIPKAGIADSFEAFMKGPYFAGAPRYTTPTAHGIGRFSLSPVTRDLALLASRQMETTPFAVEALDANCVLLIQVIPPQATAKDPAVHAGCLRLGTLTPSTGVETWVGTVGLPDSCAPLSCNMRFNSARQGDSLILTISTSSSPTLFEMPPGKNEQGEFWTRLPWPDAFPDDVPDGWLGTITPRPGTPIP